MEQVAQQVAEIVQTSAPVAAEIIELTVSQLGEVGGGVAYVFA